MLGGSSESLLKCRRGGENIRGGQREPPSQKEAEMESRRVRESHFLRSMITVPHLPLETYPPSRRLPDLYRCTTIKGNSGATGPATLSYHPPPANTLKPPAVIDFTLSCQNRGHSNQEQYVNGFHLYLRNSYGRLAGIARFLVSVPCVEHELSFKQPQIMAILLPALYLSSSARQAT